MAFTGNVADAWPAGMTTDDGTVASLVSLLDRLTVSGCARSKLTRVTVPVAAAGPEYSHRPVGLIVRVRDPSGTVRSSSRSNGRTNTVRAGERRRVRRMRNVLGGDNRGLSISRYVSINRPIGPAPEWKITKGGIPRRKSVVRCPNRLSRNVPEATGGSQKVAVQTLDAGGRPARHSLR